jgi:hypothetical protein
MMRKVLTYASFAVTSLIVILAFITATTYTQLSVAVILFPFVAFFAYNLFVLKNPKIPEVVVKLESEIPATKIEPPVAVVTREDISIKDIDKRAFLKLIGGAGITYFLLSLFNRRTEGLFGNSAGLGIATLEDTSGRKINPAESHPTDSYQISEIDDGTTAYYGFTNKDGAWFIMKEDPDTGSFRYANGTSDFPEHWDSRKNLKYDYYHNVFAGN